VRGIAGRDVHRADDPRREVVRPPDVDHVDAAGRLFEATEEATLARERPREDRPVHGAVRDDENGVPRRVGDQAVERGQDAVEQLADRLASEEASLVRDDAVEGADELVLQLRGRDRREPVAGDLPQVGPRLYLPPRGDELGRLAAAGQPARDDAVEPGPVEQRTRG
jgi:hypothetical protein